MTCLNPTIIVDILFNKIANVTIHSSSIAYIQNLLQPYVMELEIIDTTHEILTWISENLSTKISNDITSEITKYLNIDNSVVIDLVVKRLILEILRYIKVVNDNIILPWDIKKSIIDNPELLNLLNNSDKTTPYSALSIPVEIVIGPQHYTYELNEELTYGLFLSSMIKEKDEISKCKFLIKIFGVVIDVNNMSGVNRFHNRNNMFRYSVIISDVNYNFDTPEFMRGFITGMQWMGINHRKFWTDLLDKSGNGKEIPITF